MAKARNRKGHPEGGLFCAIIFEVNTKKNSPFDPTDLFRIPAGISVVHFLESLNLRSALENPEYLESFLVFNKVGENGILQKFNSPNFLHGHHTSFFSHDSADSHLFVTHRMRSLDLISFYFSRLPVNLEMALQKVSTLPHPKILEIGSGNGRLLMEIQKRIPHAVLVGLGKKKGEEGFHGVETAKKMAGYFDLPEPVIDFRFEDLSEGEINGTESFDLIISRNSLRYMKRKDLLLEKIYGRLSPGGMAFVDLQLFETPSEYFQQAKFAAIFSYDPMTLSLSLTKTTAELSLGLSFDETSSKNISWDESSPNHEQVGWHTVLKVSHGR